MVFDAFRRRLRPASFPLIARHPSAHAPRAADILRPIPEPLPAAGPALLEAFSAKDCIFDGHDIIRCSLAGRAWIAHGGLLCDAFPKLHTVRLVALLGLFDELASCPHNARIACLDLRCTGIPPATAAKITNTRVIVVAAAGGHGQ
jgi:hypothetical protein